MPDIFNPPSKKEATEESQTVQSPPQTPEVVPANVDKLVNARHYPMKLFSTFAMTPKGVTFANQEPDEVILLFLRRHFITNIPWVLGTLFLILFPPILLFLLSLIHSFTLPGGLVFIITAFYYLLIISYAFSKFISWFYNIGVVTQKRIVDLDSTNILSHDTSTANFNDIVDVKFTQQGFFQSTYDYGDIVIQVEAINAIFTFDACPKPTEVTDIISDLRVASRGGYHANS